MKFSILLNSRERPQLLRDCLFSLAFNCFDTSKIEVLINFDDDDDVSWSLRKEWNRYSFVMCRQSPRPDSIHDTINDMAEGANGKYLWIINDDAQFITPNWDIKAWDALENFTRVHDDGIVLGLCEDTSMDKTGPHKNYASFPIISKVAVDIAGVFISPECISLGGDVWAYRVYEAVNRLCKVPVRIHHCLHDTYEKVVSPDKTASEYRKKGNFVDPWSLDISEYVNKLEKKLVCDDRTVRL